MQGKDMTTCLPWDCIGYLVCLSPPQWGHEGLLPMEIRTANLILLDTRGDQLTRRFGRLSNYFLPLGLGFGHVIATTRRT